MTRTRIRRRIPDLAKDLADAEAWGAVYDEAYAARDALDESDPSLNFSGYGNSYTPGRVHRPEVVREWVETICDRIAGLRPRRALELGCGNGMILLRIAKLCERYVGTDLAANAVDYVRDVITRHPDFTLPHCGLAIAGAHEARRFAEERLDTVVCNGVSMYFPSADYLTSVVENSLARSNPAGTSFSATCATSAAPPLSRQRPALSRRPERPLPRLSCRRRDARQAREENSSWTLSRS